MSAIMADVSVSAAFASDNAAPAHPNVLAALQRVNDGPMGSYGADPVTERAADAVRSAFDCPDASQAVPKRSRSTTPLQALNLLNSSFVTQQAGLFAKRLEKNAGKDVAAQANLAFELCFNRPASVEELTDATAFIQAESLKQFTRAMLNANEFVFIP